MCSLPSCTHVLPPYIPRSRMLEHELQGARGEAASAREELRLEATRASLAEQRCARLQVDEGSV